MGTGNEKGYNKWSVMYSGKLVGNIYLFRQDNKLIDNYPSNLKVGNTFNSTIIFGEGSTNGLQGIGVYNLLSKKSYNENQGYSSIEDSTNPELNIGFRANMQNINNFANGNSVGESTISFASEFLINYGDPLLTRISDNEKVNGTNFDKGLGKLIYGDSNGGIIKVVGFDFNGDEVKDFAVGYSDGTIRLLKNYKGTDPYNDLGELMVIADGIEDLFAGDVDGDGYDDLIVKTSGNKVRVYVNKGGVFEIDGRLVCLDVPGGPDNLESLSQIFWEDMDKDGKIDVVTNDVSGDVKIFYGGKSGNGFNYLSNDYYSCDIDRKVRQKDRVKLVDNYSIQIDSQAKIKDESLVHWYGLLAAIPNYGQDGIDTTNISDVDVSKASQIVTDGFMDSAKFQTLPNSYKPSYENIQGDVVYAEIYYLSGSDPVNIYKTFEPVSGDLNLQVGDVVRVNVNIEANYATNITYLEKLRGPWSIAKGEKTMDGFDVGSLPTDAIINPNTSNGIQFMIDNIQLSKGDTITFSYLVVFKGVQAVKIKLDDTNSDTYKDIIANPSDACLKTNWINESKDSGTGKRGISNNTILYNKTEKNIQTKYEQKESEINKKSQSYFENLQSKIDKIDVNANINEIGLDDFGEDWAEESLFEFEASAEGVGFNAGVLNGQFESVQTVMENSLKGLCKGFKFDDGTCGGIPVPFNMAFLAPGEYNVFGCKLSDDPGTPVFWYPGTKWITCGDSCSCPIPMPNMKTKLGPPVESAAPSGCKPTPVYMSNIRMYLSPTLTQGMGVAVCYGPYQAGMKGWPNPSGVYMGNCVVAGTNFDVFECKREENSDEDSIDDWQFDLYNIGSCNSEFPDNSRVSPLYYSSDNTSKRGIYIDESPTVIAELPDVESSFLEFDRVALKPGKPIDLKIESGDVKGIVQCMIKKWVDKQIRYIINNLTNMTIYLYLPDVSQLVDDFSKVDFDRVSNIRGTLQDDVDKIGATWNSVSKDGKALGRSINSDFGKQIQEFTSKYTPTKGVLNKVSDTFNNPFRSIQEFFEEVPLVNVETREINIQVPFISQENILKQTAYLENRVVKQKQIVNDWQDTWKAMSGGCDSANNPGECNEIADGFLTLNADFDKLIKSVEQNIEILDSYKEFPQKLYEWLHVSDRYLSELLCIIDEFLTSIMGWLEENAQRFEKWVDVIILIIGIMETWQILVDFSVDWRSSCSKCRKDEYDYYSCKMSMLCPDLPILPIPPFKIPDIYLDFSHIDLGIDLVLPEFVFTPMDIPVFKLPDLPRPPAVGFGLNVILPSIPLLPALPELPEIPSFLPTIKLELPYLPPAPKIPELLPEVSGVLKILEFIGYLYCVIKQGIGLVAEWNVKTRIEQLTQRTNRIAPFDFLKLTMVDPPLSGYDIRVDSYVRLKFEFEMIYNLAQSLADSINEATNSMGNSLYMVEKSIGNLGEGITIPNMEYELEIDGESLLQGEENNSEGFDMENYFQEYFDLESFNMTGSIEYAVAHDKLKKELQYFSNNSKSNGQVDKAEKVMSIIDKQNKVSTNIQGLNVIKKDLEGMINENKNSVNELANMVITDYDKFLDVIGGKVDYSLVSVKNDKKTLSMNLFNGDPEIVAKISNQDHPLQTYFALNDKVVDRYIAALENNGPQDLNMDNNTYENNKLYLKNLKYKMQSVQPYLDASNIDDKLIVAPNESLEGQTQGIAPNVDLTQYINGFFTKGTSGKYHNVISREEKGTEIFKNNNYSYSDYDSDGIDDILLWDDSHIYIKYGMPFVPKNNVIYGDFYETQVWDSPTDLRIKTDTTGKISIKGKQFKVWDDAYGVSNFQRDGQSYENISVSWDASQEKTDAYLIQVTTRADVFYDKYAHIGDYQGLNVKYILVTPKNETYEGYSVYLRNNQQLPAIQGGDIIQVIQDDFNDGRIQVLLNKIDRKWLYMKVTNLYSVGLEKRLYIKSPWSNQITAGRQVWADSDSPTLELSLVRKSHGQVVSQGYSLNGLINTNYSFNVNWIDNGKVRYSWIEQANNYLTGTYNSNYNINDLYFTGIQSLQYKFGAIDHVGNKTTQLVNLNIKSPEILIENVDVTDPAGGKVFTKLSESVDDATVKYQRNRYGNWESLTGVDIGGVVSQYYQIPSDDTKITGQYFQLSNKIKFDDGSGNEIGNLDVDSGEININSTHVSNYSISVDFNENIPNVIIGNKDKTIFKINIGTEKLLGVTITNGNYDIINNIKMKGMFDGGSCIRKPSISNECLVFISKIGQIYIPSNYKSNFSGLYSFDKITKSIEYDIYDDSGSSIFKVMFEPKPFR
ncbi:MAG: FG-GAP-like repeat-containing protein [Candidatus Absconditabacteria bacterium]